jgi:hypothetical protein
VLLRASPDKRAPGVALVVHYPAGDSDRLSFTRLAVHGEWTQVIRDGFDVLVTGWARTGALELLANSPPVTGTDDGSIEGAGYHGHGGNRRTYFYEGPAHIAVGTTLFALPGRAPWAKVEKDGIFQIRYNEGDVWVAVTSIPHVDGLLLPAYVPLAAIERRN